MVKEYSNLLTSVVAARLENVLLQDTNVRENHRNPWSDRGKDSVRAHVIRVKGLPHSGIVEIVLNATGVAAFSKFEENKVAFLNSLKWRPMYRFTKREHDYLIAKSVSSTDEYLKREMHDAAVRNAKRPVSTLGGSATSAQSIRLFGDASDKPSRPMRWTERRQTGGSSLKSTRKRARKSLSRSNYKASREEIACDSSYSHELMVDSFISVHLQQISLRDDSGAITVDDLKVVRLAITAPIRSQTVTGSSA